MWNKTPLSNSHLWTVSVSFLFSDISVLSLTPRPTCLTLGQIRFITHR